MSAIAARARGITRKMTPSSSGEAHPLAAAKMGATTIIDTR